MLPEMLAGSYKRYKEDTDIFSTWLSQTAIACGYKPAGKAVKDTPLPKPTQQQTPSLAPRLKGKARKEAKAAGVENKKPAAAPEPSRPIVKYSVSTEELLSQAKAVGESEKSGHKIPDTIVSVVKRAINARRRCAAWFQKTGVHEPTEGGHLHFVTILEKALESLRPTAEDSLSPTLSKENQDTSTVPMNDGDLGNPFGVLDIEDTEEAKNPIDFITQDSKVTKKTSTSSRNLDVYEMEVQKDIDDAFTIFCFFEDLHRLQDFLKQIWEEYKAGKCDLTIASVTTNLAFNLVRRAEEELIVNLDPKRYAKPRSYGALSMTIFYEDSFDKGEDPEERLASNESLKLTPFDDFIYLPTARALMKFQRMIELGIQYPQPVPPFRFNYISRPKLLELPETKKAEKEDLLLSQLCIDSSINDLILPGIKDWRKREPPPVDGFSKGLEKLRKDGEISAWIVFASRIILDINNILGDDVARSYKELQRAGRDAKAVLDFQSEGDELGPGPSSDGLCWHSKSIELPQNIWELVDFWLEKAPLPTVKEMTDQSKNAQREPQSLEDLPIEQRQQIERELRARALHNDDVLPQHEANAKKMDLKPIKPAKEPTFLYTHNPLYCGTLTFNIAIDIELAGLALANHQLTIFAIAHLYNACRQTKIIESKWPEMERLIQMHIGQLFAGQLPTKLSECHTRLSVRLGAKASDFAPNRRANQKSQQLSGKGMKHTPKLAISDSSQILSDYSGDKEPAEKSLYRIEAAIQEYRSLQIGPAKRVTTRQLTPLQFLTHVRTWLPQITEDTKIDYITLVRTCNKLLKRVPKRIHQELGYLYPKADQGWSNDHGQIFMVASIIYQAADTQSFKEQVIKSRDRSRLPEDPQLVVAGDVLQELLPKHGAS